MVERHAKKNPASFFSTKINERKKGASWIFFLHRTKTRFLFLPAALLLQLLKFYPEGPFKTERCNCKRDISRGALMPAPVLMVGYIWKP